MASNDNKGAPTHEHVQPQCSTLKHSTVQNVHIVYNMQAFNIILHSINVPIQCYVPLNLLLHSI